MPVAGRKEITVETLFGPETITVRRKPIVFRQIRAVYETITVREEVKAWFTPDRSYTAPEQLYELFSFLKDESKEYFFAVHLNGKNRIQCIDCISIGSLNQSIVHPREVFKTALLSSAASLVLAHNHPSGDPTPSREDMEITRRLVEAGDLLNVKVLDHLVIGRLQSLSFAGSGLL